ncbi:WecB/TagA/CpsF family glycosyltransferase [Listeria grandensis]|uniref:Beta-1,4-N-acetyl-mannosaminyltransferase n=2 Tax=Listeria grandensis TaxID=1494963 RepID=W7B767_9LIST|nr:WecB/TagA/CpsF family glycosyltransferase [Listeria grandensis]EUJ18716.1 beta-1,4-N-acetyl-mannosaminyltransferase [Listeria grandensis FSL F6-0971]MBC1474302.1 WecB/TagA/CpsF family glycosyltransferase [Listeria grandensis]MBC1936310.1 WecB/TagA/CpsF family glycosyltransferase [Listeria grandensis]MBC6316937.1 WecB/TagA/CpsF family glycosyltransferase [Listeria grandensis]
MTRTFLLGSYVDSLTMQETLNKVETIIRIGKPVQHVVINASKINLMAENKELADIVNASPLINADGQSIVWAMKFLGHETRERVTGIDLFENLVKKSAEKGYRVYYFGAKEDVVQDVVRLHQQKYPKLKIAGYRNGYFEEAESEEIALDIRKSEADIVFVAFSSPKKEQWIHAYKDTMGVPFVMGVGGSFDVIAGVTKRAPQWMQKTGLEWFYRFMQEPKRMFKRYFVGNLSFIWKVLKERWRQ